jgi:glutaredoxin-like protein NrdH
MQPIEPEIKLFSLSTCSHCRSVKALLRKMQFDFREISVDQMEREDRRKAIQELKQYNQRLSFPTTVIGPKVVFGNKQDDIQDALSRVFG